MVFKIIVFLATLGLHNIYSHGKIPSIGSTAEHPEVYGIGELYDGSPTELESRYKRDTHDSDWSRNGKARAEALRGYLATIERYMPAIRDNINIIERKFSSYYHPSQHDPSHDKDKEETSINDFSGTSTNVDSPSKYMQELNFFPRQVENDENDSIRNYEDSEVNKTVISGFNEVTNPGMNRENTDDDDETIESSRDLETYKNTENGHIPPNFNPNFMPEDAFEPGHDFFQDNVKEIKHHGTTNLCDECGKIINCYDSDNPVKPLVIQINRDCSSNPKDRFINRCTLQSRAHCRPFKFNSASQKLPTHCSFHYREMPRYYHR